MMQIYTRTDIGKVRKLNEDYMYASNANDKIKLFIIADGMGGYNAGEVASKIATESAREYIQQNFEKSKSSKEEIENLIKDAIIYANNEVYNKSKKNKELSGMGTTIDICLIYNSKLYIGHVGDSRVYRIRKDFIRKITRDDSYVQTLIEDGTITKEQAFNHPRKNMITKAIGCDKIVNPTVYTKTFIKNDIIILTTDGLTNMVKDKEILELVKTNNENIVDVLVDTANKNGGSDNITVIVIKNI